MFSGDEYQKNLTFVETIQAIATQLDVSLSSLVLAWTMGQDGITTVLFGATKRRTGGRKRHGSSLLSLITTLFLAINQAVRAARNRSSEAGRA